MVREVGTKILKRDAEVNHKNMGNSGQVYRAERENTGSTSPRKVLEFACFPRVIMNSTTSCSQRCPFLEDKLLILVLKSPQDALNCQTAPSLAKPPTMVSTFVSLSKGLKISLSACPEVGKAPVSSWVDGYHMRFQLFTSGATLAPDEA